MKIIQKLTSPLYVVRNKKGTKAYLNLNNYRNWSFIVSNGLKKKYKSVMTPQIMNLQKVNYPVKLTYVLYPATKRLCDVANVCSVIDKFVCDAITELGIWEDDNYQFVPEVTYKFGAIDKENPRCEIWIEPKELPEVKVTINQAELEAAVISFFGLPQDTEVSLENAIVQVQQQNESISATGTSSEAVLDTPVQTTRKPRKPRKPKVTKDENSENTSPSSDSVEKLSPTGIEVEGISESTQTIVQEEQLNFPLVEGLAEPSELTNDFDAVAEQTNEVDTEQSTDNAIMETTIEVPELHVEDTLPWEEEAIIVDEPMFGEPNDPAIFAEVLAETADEDLVIQPVEELKPLF